MGFHAGRGLDRRCDTAIMRICPRSSGVTRAPSSAGGRCWRLGATLDRGLRRLRSLCIARCRWLSPTRPCRRRATSRSTEDSAPAPARGALGKTSLHVRRSLQVGSHPQLAVQRRRPPGSPFLSKADLIAGVNPVAVLRNRPPCATCGSRRIRWLPETTTLPQNDGGPARRRPTRTSRWAAIPPPARG